MNFVIEKGQCELLPQINEVFEGLGFAGLVEIKSVNRNLTECLE